MPTVSLLLQVDAEDLEPEEHEEHTSDLGRLLREVDGTQLTAIIGDTPPPGSKATGGALVGGLAVTVAASRKALTAVLEAIRSWVAVVASRSVVIELDGDRLEIKGATTGQLDRALDAFVARHSEADR